MSDAMDQEKRPRRVAAAPIVWAAGIVGIIVLSYLDKLFQRFEIRLPFLDFFAFLLWLSVIGLTLYGFALAVRWTLRALFWTVGRRLFLSYVMIGVFPFFLFAILLAAILYVVAGVATQANFRAERQSAVGQLESLNTEYALQGRKPRIDSVEIYDSEEPSGGQIPPWLRGTNFSGMALRGDEDPLFVVSRQYPSEDGETRTVLFARPIDRRWADELEERSGMVVWPQIALRERDSFTANSDGGGDFSSRAFAWGRILWFEITEEGGLIDWNSGAPRPGKRLLTAISNPTTNLVQFYFGGATSSSIMRAVFGAIAGLATLLMLIYFVATAFAAVLIFSISRAVNRIAKGTKAVERGDFSYRIRMKPQNQLGEMAVSFDRMTESIASLLTTVAEKERMQSEIEIAATIQRNLLPKEGPQFRGVSFSAHFEPTAAIGGDYYDVFNIDKTRLAVAIGDVSGHGLSTGLVMAMVKAAITTLVEEGAEETSLFHRLNELVFRSTERRAFMTLAFTIFDLERGTIRHTNAGHLFPYLLRQGVPQPISIESPSLPLGVRHELVTRTVEMDLQEGDAIVYLSDGIVEAQDVAGDPFGFEQLEALLATQTDRAPSNIRDEILRAIARHSGGRVADDDRTVMVLRFDNLKTNVPQEITTPVDEPALAT
ncbi:MAG TPA: SpoIIE family protein phosphatase [Thermoanaerobaculia bacterium]